MYHRSVLSFVLFCLAMLSFFLFLRCSKSETPVQPITDRIVYETDIAMQDDQDLTYYNLDRKTRYAWLTELLNRTIRGSQKSYSPERLPIDSKVVPFFVSIMQQWEHYTPLGIDTAALISAHLPYFSRLAFDESWTFHLPTMQIQKKVHSFSPLYVRPFNDSSVHVALFWIFNDSVSAKSPSETLCSRMEYNVSIRNDKPTVEWWKNNIETAPRIAFLNALLAAAKASTITLYTDSDLKNKTTWDNYHSCLYVHTIPMFNENGDTLLQANSEGEITELKAEDITAIKFVEEWQYNYHSGELVKKVKAYCPLREAFDDEGNLKGVEPCFWIKSL